MNLPKNDNKKIGGWKFLVASISLTSLIGLVNLFSGKSDAAGSSSEIDAIVNAPLPTLVPSTSSDNNAAVSILRDVSAPAPTPTPKEQSPVIERITVGSSGGSSGSPSTTTSSSR